MNIWKKSVVFGLLSLTSVCANSAPRDVTERVIEVTGDTIEMLDGLRAPKDFNYYQSLIEKGMVEKVVDAMYEKSEVAAVALLTAELESSKGCSLEFSCHPKYVKIGASMGAPIGLESMVRELDSSIVDILMAQVYIRYYPQGAFTDYQVNPKAITLLEKHAKNGNREAKKLLNAIPKASLN